MTKKREEKLFAMSKLVRGDVVCGVRVNPLKRAKAVQKNIKI